MFTKVLKTHKIYISGVPKTYLCGQITKLNSEHGVQVSQIPLNITQADYINRLILKIHTTSINPLDVMIKNGVGRVLYGSEKMMPLRLGQEGYGTVISKSPDEMKFKEGDKVIFASFSKRSSGAHSTYTTINAKFAAKAPKNIPADECGAISFAGQTAQSIMDRLDAEKTKDVLVVGAGGAVGSLVLQLCKLRGHRVDTVSSAGDKKFCEEMGSDRAFDYKTGEIFSSDVKYDAVIDCSKYKSINEIEYIKLIRPKGSFVTFSNNLFENTDQYGPLFGLLGTAISFVYKYYSYILKHKVRYKMAIINPNGKRLEKLAEMAEKGYLKVRIDKKYPLKELKRAYERVESGENKGKVVIICDEKIKN